MSWRLTNCFVKRQLMVSCFVSPAREVFGVCVGAAGLGIALQVFRLPSPRSLSPRKIRRHNQVPAPPAPRLRQRNGFRRHGSHS